MARITVLGVEFMKKQETLIEQNIDAILLKKRYNPFSEKYKFFPVIKTMYIQKDWVDFVEASKWQYTTENIAPH